jgi:hypothetical protein
MVPAEIAKIRSFQSFREQGSRHYFSSRMVHAQIQQITSWMSCMMCITAESHQLNAFLNSGVVGPDQKVHWKRTCTIIFFGAISKIICTAPTHILFRSCSGN